jgi:hypothetical protein
MRTAVDDPAHLAIDRSIEPAPGRPPAAPIERAMRLDQESISFFVYPTTVGRPVVPDEACTRETCSRGTANMPNA